LDLSNINWRFFLWFTKHPRFSKSIKASALEGFVFPKQDTFIDSLPELQDSSLIETFKELELNSLQTFPKSNRKNVVFSTALSWNFISSLLKEIKVFQPKHYQKLLQLSYQLTMNQHEVFIIAYKLMNFCASRSIQKLKIHKFDQVISCINFSMLILVKPFYFENETILNSETYHSFFILWIQLLRSFITKTINERDDQLDYFELLSDGLNSPDLDHLRSLKSLMMDLLEILISLEKSNLYPEHHQNFYNIIQWYLNLVKSNNLEKKEWKLKLMKGKSVISISLLSILFNEEKLTIRQQSIMESKYLTIYKLIVSMLFEDVNAKVANKTKVDKELKGMLEKSLHLELIQPSVEDVFQLISNHAPLSLEKLNEEGLMECFHFLFVVRVFLLIFNSVQFKK
jgi:hypothetical protein